MPIETLSESSINSLHPSLFKPASARDTALRLHRLLLDLSKDTSEKEASKALRKTADFFRETYFGLTEKKIRSRIVECLEEYFDGEIYTPLEIENIAEVTGLKEEILLPVINRMVKQKILIQGRRRRFNEWGEHYNPIYKLNK